MAAQRRWIRDQLRLEGHLHVAASDGLWCVTATGIGPLWRKLRQPCPDRRPPQSRGIYERMRASSVIYDEIAQREWTPDGSGG